MSLCSCLKITWSPYAWSNRVNFLRSKPFWNWSILTSLIEKRWRKSRFKMPRIPARPMRNMGDFLLRWVWKVLNLSLGPAPSASASRLVDTKALVGSPKPPFVCNTTLMASGYSVWVLKICPDEICHPLVMLIFSVNSCVLCQWSYQNMSFGASIVA